MIINGQVCGPARQERVNRFQTRSGFDVLILSPRAGGVGITLTAANHVIHLSRWWNPAVEDQCTDRVYRIGQDKKVIVYFPQALHPEYGEHSFDARLHGLLERKRRLSRSMLAPSAGNDSDLEEFFADTVRNVAGAELPDFAVMEPLQFEDWVLQGLVRAGYRVEKTLRAHDGGADGLAYASDGSPPLIIQCKHTQDPGRPCGTKAIDDLRRARERYDQAEARLVAITNAKQFGNTAISQAAQEGIELVRLEDLRRWPGCIRPR